MEAIQHAPKERMGQQRNQSGYTWRQVKMKTQWSPISGKQQEKLQEGSL